MGGIAYALLFIGVMAVATVSFAQTSTTTATSTAPLSGNALGVTFNATPRLAAGTQDALLALVTLQAGTGNAIQISSLPMSVSFGGNLGVGHLSDCRVRNVTNLATPLNTTVPSIGSAANMFSFASPLTINSGTTVTLAVTCDLAANAPVGGTLFLSLTPSALAATVSRSTTTVTPVTGAGINGGTGPTSGTVIVTAPTVTTPPMVPGVPNTGAGGSNLLVLAIAAVFGIGAAAVLLSRRRAV